MNFGKTFWVGAGVGAALAGTLFALQLPFREYPGVEYQLGSIPLPEDWQEKTEWAFARLMYPPAPGGRYGRGYGFGRWGTPWNQGNSIWTQDYPRADRHFVQAVRRLTRLHVRSVEQPVNLDDGAVYDWPWLYAVQTGHWQLTDAQAKSLREYLLRGGFFMADDFWGEAEWEVFMTSMRKVFPDRQVVELENRDAIFHVIYDLDDRYQVASEGSVQRGRSWKCENCPDHWRGIFDDHGRLMVAITFQSDVGDSWEWADAPYYPARYAALGIRIGVNYIVYSMTH
ncbi:conserved exported hypothetical protein [Candidatus Sulfopaludibacter sp. SbA6]|nr:conserved exported hypothetical protein [Candidatus Sulfopaludibacter sp. SbA6]